MTINIGLITNDALVMGCDSISSVTRYVLDPLKTGYSKDKDGKLVAKFDYTDLQEQVTETWGGARKMFPLHDKPTPVIATTSGIAKLNNRTISSYADEFKDKKKSGAKKRVKADLVAREFLGFVRRAYIRHHKKTTTPQQFWSELNFLVGGYGKNDPFPSLYRVNVKNNTIDCVYEKEKTGLAWEGQADAVSRLAMGYDGLLRHRIEEQWQKDIDALYKSMSAKMAQILQNILGRLGKKVPRGVDLSLPPKPKNGLKWNGFQLDLAFQNLQLQDAIDFVAFMVNLQSGKAKFVHSVATVGGRTHIGIVTKGEGIRLLNEPELTHKYTGFSNDSQ